MQGIVIIDAIVDEQGNVVEAKIVSGPPLLIASAMEAVRQWKYEPTYLNDQPVPGAAERDGNVPAQRVIRKELDGGRATQSRLPRFFVINNFRWLIVIPIVGGMWVGIGGVAALTMAFEEVDAIERMKAFGLAATIGIFFWIASIWIVTNGPRPMQ